MSMRFFSEPSFSERKFVGMSHWLTQFFLTAWLGIGLSSLVGRASDGRWEMWTQLLLIQPMFRLCVALLFVFTLSRILKLTIPSILQGVLPWLVPLQCLPGCIDLVLKVAHIAGPQPFFLNGATLPIALLSVGFAPYPLASIGALVTIATMTILLGHTIHRVLHDWKKTVLGGGIFYLCAFLLLATPSFLGWMGLGAHLSVSQAGANTVARGLIVLSQEGYWWRHVLERFPGLLGGESEVSVILLLGATAALLLGAFLGYWIRYGMRLSLKTWVFEERFWFFLYGASLLLVGGALALVQGAQFPLLFVSGIAAVLFVGMWSAAFLSVLGAGDVGDVAEDERAGFQRPLIRGEVSVSQLSDLTVLTTCYALGVSWLLGWPIFLCMVFFLISQFVYRSSSLQVKSFFPISSLLLGFSLLMVWLCGWFFMLQDTIISHLSVPLLVGMWLLFSSHTLIKNWQQAERFGRGVFFQAMPGLSEVRARWLLAGVVGGGYLLPGLCTRSWFWLCFGAAIGFASSLILLSKRPKILELRGLFAIFLVVSVFILARS